MSTATVRTPARFDAPSRRVEGGYAVYPNALLFEAGDYEDKQITITEADFDANVAGFTPIWGNIEHTNFLKGKAFEIRAIRKDEKNPKRLRGDVAVLLPLDSALDDDHKGFSAEWDRQTKRLVGGALTVNPRIKGASLVASFADEAMTHDDDPALLKETIKALAAFCACQAEAPTTRTVEAPMPMKKEQLKQYLDSLADDADVDDGAASMILFPDAGDGDDDMEEAFEAAPEPSNFSSDPEAIALRAEVEALKAERRREKAALFAAAEVRAGRITPFEEANAAAVMFQAMSDDDADPATVHFSQSGKPVTGTRVALVQATYGQRTPRHYGPQLAAGTGGTALAQFDAAGETDEAYAARVNAKHNRNGRINGTA